MKDDGVITWTSSGDRYRSGHADAVLDAWDAAVSAALELMRQQTGARPVRISVGTQTCRLYPEIDEHNRFDEPATRAVARQLLRELRAELGAASESETS